MATSLQRRVAPLGSQQALCSLTDAYELFGLRQGAPLQALKGSYHALALMHHPDKQGSASDPGMFERIKAAYELLQNSRLATLDRGTSVASSGIEAKAEAEFEALERKRHAREVQKLRMRDEQSRASDRARASERARASGSAPTLGNEAAYRQHAFGTAPAFLFDNVVYTRSHNSPAGEAVWVALADGTLGSGEDVWVEPRQIRREYRREMSCTAWVLTTESGSYALPAGDAFGSSPNPWNSYARGRYCWAAWWRGRYSCARAIGRQLRQ